MVVTLELIPDRLFISRVHRSNGYQSLWEKSLLLSFLQLFFVQSATKKKYQYSAGAFFECKPTRSHTTAASTFTFLLTWSSPFPYRVPGLFFCILGCMCQRQLLLWCRTVSCQGCCVQSHLLAQQQSQWDNTAKYHAVLLCRAVLLAITPPLCCMTQNMGSNHELELQPHIGSTYIQVLNNMTWHAAYVSFLT